MPFNAQDTHRAPVRDRAPVRPGQRRQPRYRARARSLRRRAQAVVSRHAPGPAPRRADAAAAAAGSDRHVRADQGAGGVPNRQHLHARCDRLDGAVVPGDRGHALAGLADREDPPPLRRLPRGQQARARPARPADHDPRRHPASARRRAGLRRPVQGRPRRRDGLLRRRRHLRGRLPRGAELRRRLARPGGLRGAEQPVGHLGAAQEADTLPHDRAEGAGLRIPRDPGGRQRRARRAGGKPRGGGARARRRRPDADRVRHVSPRRPHHRRRSDQVPVGGRGQGLGAQGSLDALSRLSGEEEPDRARARRGDRRGDRPRRQGLRGDRRRRPARHVRPRLRGS